MPGFSTLSVCERPSSLMASMRLPNGTVAAVSDWQLSTVMASLVAQQWDRAHAEWDRQAVAS